ncbi:hypothetical protein F7725_019337 [Dissostichus mawsoni]|uniref:Uncharacterized protein n=1 Tax=Dissostichus mawsoni TaxID=36200 RepID=A0A7J5YMS1_DISMA|nr:hypothetical protein F7725_019337 [Dissostichus mawsoni]
MESQSRVFAEILPAAAREFAAKEKEHGFEMRAVNSQNPGNVNQLGRFRSREQRRSVARRTECLCGSVWPTAKSPSTR